MEKLIDLESVKLILKERLKPKRYLHSIGVSNTSVRLAKLYGVCEKKAEIAGILHDYARNLSHDELSQYINEFKIATDEVIDTQVDLAHGLIGAELVKNKFNIEDEDILNAIRYHTTGRKHMSKLEKIIYLADYIEPNRKAAEVEKIRGIALYDLNKAVLMALDNCIKYVIKKGLLLHNNSILARNSLILERISVKT